MYLHPPFRFLNMPLTSTAKRLQEIMNALLLYRQCLKLSTHRRRDATAELSCVGVGGVNTIRIGVGDGENGGVARAPLKFGKNIFRAKIT